MATEFVLTKHAAGPAGAAALLACLALSAVAAAAAEAPAGGALRILYSPPGGEGAYIHYHALHEWAYNIAGDFTNNEATMPDAAMGPQQRFVEGNFLSRPPYSLHGGERGRMKWMA